MSDEKLTREQQRDELRAKLAVKLSGSKMKRSSVAVKTNNIDKVAEMVKEKHPELLEELNKMREMVTNTKGKKK